MFSDIERKIGLALYKGPKTPEELADELNEDIRDILDGLKRLMKLKIVVKEGYPPKYRLADHIMEAVKPKELEDVRGVKIYAVIEVQALEEALAKKALEKIISSLKKEPGVHVASAEISEIKPNEDGTMYSGFVETTLVFEGFEPLMHFLFFYGPSVIEVKGPENISFDIGDFQRGLLEAAGMIQGYVHYITRMMTRKEIEEFNKKLWKQIMG